MLHRLWPAMALPVFIGVIIFAWCDTCWTYDFYCAGENSCFREWISSISGFAALITAVLLILQIRITERQHRRAVGIQIRPTWKLAQKVKVTSEGGIEHCDKKIGVWQTRVLLDRRNAVIKAEEDFTLLDMIIDGEDYRRLQTEIDVPNVRLEQARKALVEYRQLVEAAPNVESIRRTVISCHQVVRMFLEGARDRASSYLTDIEFLLK